LIGLRAGTNRSGACRRASIGIGAALALLALFGPALADPPPSRAATPAKPAAAKPSPAGFTVEATPKWVVEVPQNPAPPATHASMHFPLIDLQTRIDRDTVVRYVHKVRVIDDAAGLANGSQIQIEFDPQYQKLALHGIAIWRDGKRIDKTEPKKINLLQRETRLEAQMYDGRMTASRVLDDVRAGDRIEWSYSLRGDNPVFGGRFVDSAWSTAQHGPIDLFQYRLLAPEGRTIHCDAPAAVYDVASQVHAGTRETIVRRHAVAQFDAEPSTLPSEVLREQVYWSEYADWGEVSRWAHGLFARAQDASPDVAEQARLIREQAATPEEALRRSLDFVQTQVRYFGTEMGPYSHQPAAPGKVLAQRFGDCKDKVSLLIALLRAMDIKAEPVLVSQHLRGDVERLQPTPLAFNHAIARVELGDRVYWLDGTRAFQTGALDGRGSVGLGKGLVARDDAGAALSELPGTEKELRAVAETIVRVARFDEDPAIELRLTYSGDYAEIIRSGLASRAREDIEKSLLGDLARFYPNLRKAADLDVQEVPERNAVVLRLAFTVPDYWRFPEQKRLAGNFFLVALADALRVPSQAPRTRALMIPMPGLYRESVRFEFPEDVYAKSASTHFDEQNKFFVYHVRQEGGGRANRVEGELAIVRDRVDAPEWSGYLEIVNKVWPHFGGSIGVPAMRLDQIEKFKADAQVIDDEVHKGRIRIATPEQFRARGNLLLFDTEIQSGRLAPKLRAQALVRRGEAQDHLGDYEPARADFRAAAELDPSNAQAHAAMAVSAMLSRKDDEVDAEVARALELAPSDNGPRYTRLFSDYMRGRYQQAQDEALELLKSADEADRSYAALFLFLSATRLGTDGRKAIEGHLPSASEPAWPYPVLRLFAGQIGVDEAAKAAGTDRNTAPSRLCELYFYAGEQALTSGDRRMARQYLKKSVDTGVTEFNEFAFAQRELDRLGSN
jgi:lipoprotein NlpI/transglutaminase-like putative cysteine protease